MALITLNRSVAVVPVSQSKVFRFESGDRQCHLVTSLVTAFFQLGATNISNWFSSTLGAVDGKRQQ